MNTGIFIDDTGSSGNSTNSKYDNSDRKTWLAVIIDKSIVEDRNLQMRELIADFSKIYNTSEFHFTDIYNGRNKFKNVDYKSRMKVFWEFAHILKLERFPMFIQSFTSEDILRNKIVIDSKQVFADNFNLAKVSDFSLYFLLLRLKKHLLENKQQIPVDIFIDEGKQKKNTFAKCSLLKNIVQGNKIHFKDSKDEPLIQIADFVAFTMNRVRWINSLNLKKEKDIEFLEMAEYANFNILNIKRVLVDLNENFTERYDQELEKAFKKNNNLNEIELENLIKLFNK
jgi:hypothetical protein